MGFANPGRHESFGAKPLRLTQGGLGRFRVHRLTLWGREPDAVARIRFVGLVT